MKTVIVRRAGPRPKSPYKKKSQTHRVRQRGDGDRLLGEVSRAQTPHCLPTPEARRRHRAFRPPCPTWSELLLEVQENHRRGVWLGLQAGGQWILEMARGSCGACHAASEKSTVVPGGSTRPSPGPSLFLGQFGSLPGVQNQVPISAACLCHGICLYHLSVVSVIPN